MCINTYIYAYLFIKSAYFICIYLACVAAMQWSHYLSQMEKAGVTFVEERLIDLMFGGANLTDRCKRQGHVQLQ